MSQWFWRMFRRWVHGWVHALTSTQPGDSFHNELLCLHAVHLRLGLPTTIVVRTQWSKSWQLSDRFLSTLMSNTKVLNIIATTQRNARHAKTTSFMEIQKLLYSILTLHVAILIGFANSPRSFLFVSVCQFGFFSCAWCYRMTITHGIKIVWNASYLRRLLRILFITCQPRKYQKQLRCELFVFFATVSSPAWFTVWRSFCASARSVLPSVVDSMNTLNSVNTAYAPFSLNCACTRVFVQKTPNNWNMEKYLCRGRAFNWARLPPATFSLHNSRARRPACDLIIALCVICFRQRSTGTFVLARRFHSQKCSSAGSGYSVCCSFLYCFCICIACQETHFRGECTKACDHPALLAALPVLYVQARWCCFTFCTFARAAH